MDLQPQPGQSAPKTKPRSIFKRMVLVFVIIIGVLLLVAVLWRGGSWAWCKYKGGEWGRIGLDKMASCNLSTKDGGRECTDASQCESRVCGPTNLTKEQINIVEQGGIVEGRGVCYGWKTVVGCIYNMSKGRVLRGPCFD